MSSNSNYDPDEELPPICTEAAVQMLRSPIIFDFNKPPTPAGMNPSHHSSLSSPPQSTTHSSIFPFDDLDCPFNGNIYQQTSPFDTLGTTLPTDDHLETLLMNSNQRCSSSDTNSLEFDDDKLQIIAEPKAFFRERYSCEIDKKKNRAQRYIRTEDGTSKYEHPTIKIPSKYRDPSRQLYIRVTSITIKPNNADCHCIHPYEIDTQENNVVKDKENNSLYFPVNENEMKSGEKSFLIIRKKMIQSDLKSYGPFRLFDLNQFDQQRVQNLQDAKQKIAVYQLWKSQLVFTLTELQNNNSLLVPMFHTSVESQIMTDESVVTSNSPTDHLNEPSSIQGIKCIPQQGSWIGGDEIVIIMPNPIKRKEYTISFDFGQYGVQSITEILRIDTKTILFRTPSCRIPPGNENLKVSIIIQENKSIISPIDFYYITPMKTTINICSHCRGNGMSNPVNNKRGWEYDTADSLVSEMTQLSLESKPDQSRLRISVAENNSKFDKYLNQLKTALEIFIRKNDPSRLFRRTRILLSKYDKDPSPLHDAIEHGHIQLALALIEQIIDMPSPNRLLESENEHGETPLLIAVKVNEWELIECILKTRSDLAKQKDKEGNNLFHILANMNEDKGAEIIENLLKILPNDIKNLLKDENQHNQTAMHIAQSHGNTQCINLFTSSIDLENNNI